MLSKRQSRVSHSRPKLSRNYSAVRSVVPLNLSKVKTDLEHVVSTDSRGLTKTVSLANYNTMEIEEATMKKRKKNEDNIETHEKIKNLEKELISTEQICRRLVVPFAERCPKLDQEETCYVSVLAGQPSLIKIALEGLTSPLKLKVDYSLN